LPVGSDPDERLPEPDPAAGAVAEPGADESVDEDWAAVLAELLEGQRREPKMHEKVRQAVELGQHVKELQEQLERLQADPSSDPSPWMSTQEFRRAEEVAGDPSADERRRHLAEIELQLRVTLHTAWKARQLDDRLSERAQVAARQVSRAAWALVFATSILVLATIGLIVATVMHR